MMSQDGRMTKKMKREKTFFAALAFGILAWGIPLLSVAQTPAQRETDVEKLLVQANSYFQKADYKLAVGCYLEASALTKSRMNLSQAYFGLALSYYHIRDTASSVRYMRKVLEVDPNKEISELFYPKAFVQQFDQVRQDAAGKKTSAVEKVTAPKPVPAQAEEAPPAKTEKKDETAKKEEPARKEAEQPKPAEKPVEKPTVQQTQAPETKTKPAAEPPREKPLTLGEYEVLDEEKGGYWEISAHYSYWGINLIKGMFENSLTDKLGQEIQNQIIKKSGTVQAGLVPWTFTQDLAFDSRGSNYGLELRYYSAGRLGTFSLGLALEKTELKFTLNGTANQTFTNAAVSTVDVKSTLLSSPFSTHVNFRWEVGQSAMLKPYFVLGFGFAPLKGTFSYSYTGTFKRGEFSQTITDNQEKDFDTLSTDIDFDIPNILVILQLNFGIKAQIYQGLSLLGEAGLWDGFILRAGLAYRF
jgi:tetratricopeptide (TPR) repeat protein